LVTGSLMTAFPLVAGFALGMLAMAVLLLLARAVRRRERAAGPGSASGGIGNASGGGGATMAGFDDTRSLSASFSAAIRTLRRLLPGRDWRYEVPWVLLLGDRGSGKSALASSIGLHRPFDLAIDPDLAGRGCAWHVFEGGIVLDPAGGMTGGAFNEKADGKARQRLLSLLVRHRAERGLDGVVVTVSCADLVGPDRLDANTLAARAKGLRRDLRELQQQLGLRLPVCLVVTKCDMVPGFLSFWRPLAAQHGDELFGWSNNRTLETVFHPGLIIEALDEIGRDLHRALIATAVGAGDISDMAFLFPAEFQKLAPPLSRFADRLFHADSYQDPHFFRGVYFTGDGAALTGAGLPAPGGDAELPAPLSGAMPELIQPPAARPLLVTDLFGKKIFREARVVQPARRGLVARNQAVRHAQIALAMLTLILGMGSWYSYRTLQTVTDGLTEQLRLVADTDSKIRQARQAGQSLTVYRDLRDVTPRILGAFETISSRKLLAYFLPSSWFSPIAGEVQRGLAHGFDLVVLHPMRQALIGRWTDIQKRYAGPPPPDGGESAPVTRVDAYLDELDRLAGDIALYHNARQLPVETFAGLAQSLLDVDLGEVLRNDSRLYAEVMADVTLNPIDFSVRTAASRETLARLVHDATALMAVDGPIARRFRALATSVEGMELARLGTPEEAGGALQDLGAALTRAQAILASPTLRWLFTAVPQPDGIRHGALPRIRDNPFLGPAAAADALTVVTGHIQSLRNVLLALRTPGTGALLVAGPAPDGFLGLSPPLAGLAAVLPDILRYDFMADTMVRQPTLPSMRSTAVMWMPEPLAKAMSWYRRFEEMEAGPLARVSETLRPMLRTLAAQRLQGAMLTAVAEAEVVEPRGQDFRQVADETALLREVRQFSQAARGLGDVLAAFSRRGFDQAYGTVGAVVAQHLGQMLEQADRIAEEGAPYLPLDEFREWDGTLPLNFDGWQVLSDVELAQYLDATRDRFNWLGTEVASPLVNFALREQTPAALRSNAYVLKWQRILLDQQRYKADSPTSTLAQLERFIRFDLGMGTRPENCLQQFASGSGGGDFFQQRRDTLRRMALTQCQHQVARSVSADYAPLAADFNSLLAGRYPFADYSGADTPEADLDTLTAFLERFTATEPAIRRGIGNPAPATPAARALDFVNRMAAVRNFMAPFLSPTSTAPAGFDVTAEFRVNRTRESGGNQIIDWSVVMGDQRLQRGGEVKAIRWAPGMPATATLRWAKDAPMVPVSVIGADGAVQADRTIAFAYTNRWSLLRLLQAHRPPPADLPRMADPQPHTLKFSADTANVAVAGASPRPKPLIGGQTSVFLRLGLASPNPDGKTKTTYALPVFPYAAPRLETAGRAVTTTTTSRPEETADAMEAWSGSPRLQPPPYKPPPTRLAAATAAAATTAARRGRR
jgi:type VI secretion system protein ImpL